jgi:hypothetical protein
MCWSPCLYAQTCEHADIPHLAGKELVDDGARTHRASYGCQTASTAASCLLEQQGAHDNHWDAGGRDADVGRAHLAALTTN